MSLTMPYGQNHYMGECATESAALVWIRDNKWDSVGDGTGNPQAGMAFFDTGATKLKVHDGSAWVALGSATPGGSSGQIQYNNSSTLGGASQLYWDSGNAGLAYGKTTVDGSRFDVVTVEGTYPYQATMHGSNQSYGCFVSIRKARGSQGSETTVADGDPIGGVSFRGYGSAFTTVAAIKATVSGTVSGNNIPTKLELQTHNGTAFDMRVLITAAGKVGIANASPVALLALGTAGTTAGSLSLAGATSGTCTVQVAAAAGTSTVFQLPATNGTDGYFLKTNGLGVTSWSVVSATPAGSTGYVQFNNAGAFGADAAFFWDNTNKRLGIGCTNPIGAIEISKDTANASMFASVFSSSTNCASVYVQRGRGTRASKSAVQSGDRLGQLGFAGYYDTSNNYGCSFVAAYATENWGAGARGSDLRFELTAATTATVVERMRLTSAGNVFIGTTSGNSINGTVYTYSMIVAGADASTQINGIISEGSASAGRFVGIRHNGSLSGKTAVASGDVIASFSGLGWDGGVSSPTYVDAAQIRIEVDGTVSEDIVPGRMVFNIRNTSGTYAERMRITNSGNVFIGTTAGVSINGATQVHSLIVYGTDSNPQFSSISNESSANTSRFQGFRHNGTFSVKTAVASGDVLCSLNSVGWDGGASPTYITATNVQGVVDGTVSAGIVPGRIAFNTRNSTGTLAERMRITSAGFVGIANVSPSSLLTLGTAGTTAGSLSLEGLTSGTCTVRVASVAGTSTIFQLPATNGTNGHFLKTDGTGVTSWAAVSATPAGSSNQIQYNNGGAFGASANMAWDGTSRFTMTADQTWAGCSSFVYASGGNISPYYGFYRYNNTQASPTAVVSGNILGELLFHGSYSSSQHAIGWRVAAVASGTWSSGTTPSYFHFTLRNNGTDDVRIMTLASGVVAIGTHTTATERLDIQDGSANGAIRVGNTANSNAGTIKYTSNTFSGYNGSAWVNFGAGAPAGSNTQVQFNNSGSFGADSAFTWDNTNKQILLPGNDVYSGIHITSAATTNKFSFIILRRYRNTIASPSAVQSEDALGQIAFQGFGATANRTGADFVGYADGTWTDSSAPTYMVFRTSASGSTTPTERMRITSAGNIGIGCADPSCIIESSLDSGNNIGLASTFSTDSHGIWGVHHARGTRSSPAVVQANDTLGGFLFFGQYNTALANRSSNASMYGYASELWSNTARGSYIVFYTTANTTTSTIERMRITDAGIVQIGRVGGATGQINLLGTTSGTVSLKVADVAGSWTMTLPAAAPGVTGYVLSATTAGVCSWVAAGSSTAVDAGTAAGQVLYWNSGSSKWTYTETSELVWDDTNKRVGINEAAPSSRLDVGGDVEIASNGWHYYGDPSTDGSWRTGRVSADLVVQKRDSGTWNTKHTFS